MAIGGNHLAFLDHVHQFDALQGKSGRIKCFEAEHGPDDPFDGPVVLLDEIVQILDLTDLDLGTGLFDERLKGGGVGSAFILNPAVGLEESP